MKIFSLVLSFFSSIEQLVHFQDYFTQGYSFPPEDEQQDAYLMYAMERDGRTIISYSRKRDTGDAQDVAIEVRSCKKNLP